jgi:hypothetical protein
MDATSSVALLAHLVWTPSAHHVPCAASPRLHCPSLPPRCMVYVACCETGAPPAHPHVPRVRLRVDRALFDRLHAQLLHRVRTSCAFMAAYPGCATPLAYSRSRIPTYALTLMWLLAHLFCFLHYSHLRSCIPRTRRGETVCPVCTRPIDGNLPRNTQVCIRLSTH